MIDPTEENLDEAERELLLKLEYIREQRRLALEASWKHYESLTEGIEEAHVEDRRIESEKSIARMEAIKKDHDWDEALKIEAERQTAITIDSFSIVGTRLFFKIHAEQYPPQAFSHVLRAEPSRNYNMETGINSVEVSAWKSFSEKLQKAHDNLIINYTPDEIEAITKYKEPSAYVVKMDHRSVIVHLGPKAVTYTISDKIKSAEYNYASRTFRIPFIDAYKLVETLADKSVDWDKDVEELLEQQIKNRARLDAVAIKTSTDIEIPLKEGMKLKDFQAVSVEFVDAANGRAAINHEMGLGKTPCAIGTIEYRQTKKNLLVVPAMVKPNWMRELNKFSTGGSVYELLTEMPTDFDVAQVLAGGHRFYVITYDALSTAVKVPAKERIEDGKKIVTDATIRYPWVEILNMANFECIVLDEAHYIKNVDSNRSKCVRMLKSRDIIPLTGTPVLNRPQELWALLNVIDKDVAGPYETFVNHFTIGGKSVRNVEELREIMKPYMFRKTKKDVLPELPKINRIIRDVELSADARKRYEKALAGLFEDISGWTGSTEPQAINSILAQLLRCKQICAEDKIDYVADLATQVYDETDPEDSHRKVIIVSQFSDSPPMIKQIASRLGNEALYFTGAQTPSERQDIVDRFQNDPEIKFLVFSIKAGGVGLNITAAGAMIFTDLTWTPADHQQAEARAYGRLSDLHSLNAYYLLAPNTIEVDINNLLQAKLDIIEQVVEGAEASRDNTGGSIAMELIRKLKGM